MAKINVAQFAILSDSLPNVGLTYTVSLGFKGAADAKRVANEFSAEFIHNEKTILKLSVICEFDIHEDDWFRNLDGSTLRIGKEDLGYLANQSVGVARGIMFCKTEGTQFSSLILPPIDLTQILQEDLVIEF